MSFVVGSFDFLLATLEDHMDCTKVKSRVQLVGCGRYC